MRDRRTLTRQGHGRPTRPGTSSRPASASGAPSSSSACSMPRDKVLWASGRTNGAGVDRRRNAAAPIAGELWWQRRLLRPHRTRRPRTPAALPGDHPPGPGADLRGAGRQPRRTWPRRSAAHDAEPDGALTTSFLSICAKVKDNRLLPHGFLPLDDRIEIADGARRQVTTSPRTSGRSGVGDDPDYAAGGGDGPSYRIPLARAQRASRPRCARRSTIRPPRRIICRTASAPLRATTPSGSITWPVKLRRSPPTHQGLEAASRPKTAESPVR